MNQQASDRAAKRRFTRWEHEEWNEDYRQLIPQPEPESWTEFTDYTGRVIRRHPDISGDLETYYREPWRL